MAAARRRTCTSVYQSLALATFLANAHTPSQGPPPHTRDPVRRLAPRAPAHLGYKTENPETGTPTPLVYI